MPPDQSLSEFCSKLPKLRTWVRFPSPAPVTPFPFNNLAICRAAKGGNKEKIEPQGWHRETQVLLKHQVFSVDGISAISPVKANETHTYLLREEHR
jgi:hypothetical protein